MKDKNKSIGININVLIGVLLGVVVVVVGLVIFKMTGEDSGNKDVSNSQSTVSTESNTVEKWQEGIIRYDGVDYRYNNDIRTFLFMGIDKAEEVAEGEDGIDGGQSDAMFLLVINPDTEKISVIAINRNTMTTVDVYGRDGNYRGTAELQICLQHGYGDGMRISCTRTVNTVSRLFDNIPIAGYFSINMNGIPILNDAVGGVTVEVLEDINSYGHQLKKGETVTLKGTQSLAYVRSRDTDEFDSATRRLERQQQYIISLMSKMKSVASQGEKAIMSMYESAEDYIVTNIDFLELAEAGAEYSFDSSDMYTIPGETIMGARFEEHYIDENALYDMIIEIFYEVVE